MRRGNKRLRAALTAFTVSGALAVPTGPLQAAPYSVVRPGLNQRFPAVSPAAPASPVITGLDPTGCVYLGGYLAILGRGFGAAGDKAVALDNAGVRIALPVSQWTDTEIYVRLPEDAGLASGRSYPVGVEQPAQGRWLSNTDHSITVCAAAAVRAPYPPAAAYPAGTLAPAPASGGAAQNGLPDNLSTQAPAAAQYDIQPQSPAAPSGIQLTPPPALPRAARHDPDTIEPGEILVASATMDDARSLAQALGPLGISVERRRILSGLGVVLSTLRLPKGMTVARALKSLRARYPKVLMDANHRYAPLGEAAAAGLSRRYAMRLIGWGTPAATCGRGLRIGLIDGAPDRSSPALAGETVIVKHLLSPGVEQAPPDHATAIAGLLIGAPASRFPGLLPGATLYAAAVLRQRDRRHVDTTAEMLVYALDWLIRQRVRVINISLGGAHNRLLALAVRRALARGIAVAAAAGNGGPDGPAVYPAAQKGVLAVTAVDVELRSYRLANRGDYVAFAAPGVDIWAAGPGGRGHYVSGTSYATPFVTAALAAARLTHPKAPWPALEKQLQRTARDLGAPGKDPVFGWGLVQAAGCSSLASGEKQ